MNQDRQFIYVVLVVLLLVIAGKCAVSTKHSSSLGVPMYGENPMVYIAGSLATTPDAVSVVDGNMNLRIKPVGTYMLFDQSLLLCGMPTDKFNGVTEPFVLTYERQARRLVRGIGCHELIRADSLKEKTQ